MSTRRPCWRHSCWRTRGRTYRSARSGTGSRDGRGSGGGGQAAATIPGLHLRATGVSVRFLRESLPLRAALELRGEEGMRSPDLINHPRRETIENHLQAAIDEFIQGSNESPLTHDLPVEDPKVEAMAATLLGYVLLHHGGRLDMATVPRTPDKLIEPSGSRNWGDRA